MAQESKHKGRPVDDEEEPQGEEPEEGRTSAPTDGEALVLAARDDEEGSSEADEDGESVGEGGEEGADGEGGEGQAAAHLGSERYVLAGFFAAGMLGAYVLGRAIQALWINASNKDWFAQNLPRLAAVADEDKAMYGIVLGGIIALFTVYRVYKMPEVRTWSDEVASELAKVVWPSQKEVTSSTFIVIVASAAATIYLALLDRLWAFVTNIVYGDGS